MKYATNVLPQVSLNSPSVCHQCIGQDLEKVPFAEGILAVHYIDDILLVGANKDTIHQGLHIVLIHMGQYGWAINIKKVQEPSIQVKFQGRMYEIRHLIPKKMFVNLLAFSSPNYNKSLNIGGTTLTTDTFYPKRFHSTYLWG